MPFKVKKTRLMQAANAQLRVNDRDMDSDKEPKRAYCINGQQCARRTVCVLGVACRTKEP